MQISKALEDAIKEQNLVRIYGGFYVIAHENPNFSSGKFDETLRYVKSKNIPGFMQEYNGKEFAGQEKWTEEYWAEVVSDLIDNFCEERIQHLKEIGIFLFPVSKMSGASNHGNVNSKEDSRSRQGGKTKAGSLKKKPSLFGQLFPGSDKSHDQRKETVKRQGSQVQNKKNTMTYRMTDKRNRQG